MKTGWTDKLFHIVINVNACVCSEIRLNFLFNDINGLVGKE